MPAVSASIIVPAPIREVFDFIADYRNLPFLQPHFVSSRLLTENATGPGATVELKGHFHGLPMKVHNRIITCSPPRRLVSISEGSILSRSAWELEPLSTDPLATRVTLTIDYSLRKVMGGLFMGMGSALWPLFNREVQSMTNESLKRLKAVFQEGKG